MKNDEQKHELGQLFENAQLGDGQAENELAEYLFPIALELARKKLAVSPTPMVDHEDLACSAIRSLCLRVRDKKVDFAGDKSLGALLKKIVVNKAAGYWRRESTEKRNYARNQAQADEEGKNVLDFLASTDPQSAILSEGSIHLRPHELPAFSCVLEQLQDDLKGLFSNLFKELTENTRQALLLMLEDDNTNQELAEKLDCSIASVERYRASIRRNLAKIVEGS